MNSISALNEFEKNMKIWIHVAHAHEEIINLNEKNYSHLDMNKSLFIWKKLKKWNKDIIIKKLNSENW